MIVSGEQIVSIHTRRGAQLYQLPASEYSRLEWTRMASMPSKCTLQTVPGYLSLPELQPWAHWVSVWDGDGRSLYWTGPIRRVEQGDDWLQVQAFDVGVLMAFTRCPISRRWDAAAPTEIAAALWQAMLDQHGVRARADVRRDPRADRFAFSCLADSVMLDEIMDQLVTVGLHWSVVAGTPLLGPVSLEPVAALSRQDFVEADLVVVRDGSVTHNDVLLRAGDAEARARVPMADLALQAIVTVDEMSGVSNAAAAVRQYTRQTARIRDAISVPRGAVLHPEAPVTIDQLVPTARINVDAHGLLTRAEVQGVTVTCSQGVASVAVDLEAVHDDPPELVEIGAAQW